MNLSLTVPNLRSRAITEGLPSRQRWQWGVLGVVLIGATMSALDVSIVNIALPTIKRDFDVPLSLVEWVSIAYMMVLAISLPIVGRLADIFGRSLLYNIGFGVFVAGSALCGLAPNAVILVLARALQAIGAGLLQANSVALITYVFRSRQLGRALGIQAAVQATAMALGPFVGAILVAWVGWRSIFYVNVPIGIVGGIAAHFVLPRYHPTTRREKIDYLGSFLFTGALLGIALAVNQAQASGWGAPIVRYELFAGLVGLALFIITENRAESPMIDLGLFRHYQLVAGNVTAFLAYYALFAVLFLLPFYFEQVLGYDTLLSGEMLTPVPLAMAVLAPLAGTASNRFGVRKLTFAGSLMLMAGCLLMMLAGISPHPVLLVVAMVILGAGLGIFTPANNRGTMAATPRAKLGLMGGLLNMMRSIGLILGIDISGMVFILLANTQTVAALHTGADPQPTGLTLELMSKAQFVFAFHGVMLSLAGVAALSAVLSFFRKHEGPVVESQIHQEPMELM